MPVIINGTTGISSSGDLTVEGNLFTERYGLRYRQAMYNAASGTTATSLDYRIMGGLNFKNLGHFQFRAGNQYLHIKTNVTSNSQMFLFFAHGYLYNNGNMWSISGGYTYTAPNQLLNQYTQNTGNCSISGTYRTAAPSTGGYLCLRMNRNSPDYTEGFVTVYYHTHGIEMNSCEVLAYSQNNNAGAFYTS